MGPGWDLRLGIDEEYQLMLPGRWEQPQHVWEEAARCLPVTLGFVS